MTNLVFSVVQLAHNLGAVAVVGGPAAVLYGRIHDQTKRRLMWLILCAWLLQVISGMAFGLTSYYLKGQLPEVEGIAFLALSIKLS